MLKAYIIAYIVCFVITVAIMAAVVIGSTYEWNKEKEGEGEDRKPAMERKDRLLMPLRIAAVSAVMSIPAPLTLAMYAVILAALFLQGMAE